MLDRQKLAELLAEKAKSGQIAPKGATIHTNASPSLGGMPSAPHMPNTPSFHVGSSTSQPSMPKGTSMIPKEPSAPKFNAIKMAVGGMIPEQTPMQQPMAQQPGMTPQQQQFPQMLQLLKRKQ